MAPDPTFLQRQSFLARVSQEFVDPPEQPKQVAVGRIVRVSAIDRAGHAMEVGERPSMTYANNDEYPLERKGNTLTAIGHVITAVIGAGVLALPYSVAVLGWVAGPLCILIFAFLTLYTSQLLADVYIVDGKRNRTYTDAVYSVFGRWGFHTIGWIQHSNLILTALAYTITGAQSLQTVARSVCDQHGVTDGCFDRFWKWACIFGGVQIVLSQLPNLNYFWWASIIGAIMSFSYSTIAFGISVGNADNLGSVGGMHFDAKSDKAFEVLNALGAILFAFSFSMILIEIQDTLKSPKGAGKDDTKGPIKPMKRAVNVSVAVMTAFYLAVAISGYAALGDNTPYNILTGPGGNGWSSSQVPYWVIDLANVMVLVHMIPAFQVYSQPFLCFAEHHLSHWKAWPKWFTGWKLRLVWRTFYVCLLTFLSILMPFFGYAQQQPLVSSFIVAIRPLVYILGFVGAIGFWPATVFFPIEMWIRVFKPRPGLKAFLRFINIISFLITLATVIGSVELIIVSWTDFQIFQN